MNTTVGSVFNVHINYHAIVKFFKFRSGMYCFDTAKSNKYLVNTYSFLSTVKDNKLYFILREIEGVDIARNPQGKLAGLLYNTTKIPLPTIK